jgi:hypothetical protein
MTPLAGFPIIPLLLRCLLVLMLSGALLHAVRAQSPQPDTAKNPPQKQGALQKKDSSKKQDGNKEATKKQDAKKQDSSKTQAKPVPLDKKQPAETSGKAAAEKMELPSGAILVLVKDLNEALQKQGIVLLSPEKLRAMQARIADLERKFKEEKKLPHFCKLSGNVEGDHVLLQADFAFYTDVPERTVVLGLQGGNLTDEGALDRQPPILDYGPEGYSVQVAKPGSHQLTLKLKVPVGVKRTTTPGGGSERGFELSLPGAAVTLLALELPAAVKEIRWNDRLESQREAARRGRWELALGKIKNLNLSWKEPAALPGNAALLTAEGQITVKVEEGQVTTNAELVLGDLRGQAKEWHLLLPPQAKVEVKAPAGLLPEVIPPRRNGLVHTIRLKEPTSERLQVNVQTTLTRPFPQSRRPIGPFILLDAFEQRGTISIKATSQGVRGYRLLYYPRSEVYQRDASSSRGPDIVAQFRYEKLPNPGQNVPLAQASTWVPLEIELKAEKSQVEAQIEHVIQLGPIADGWQADLTTKIKVRSLSGGVDYVDVQLPRCRPEGLALLNVSPYPAGLPWAGLPWGPLYLTGQRYWPILVPADFTCHSESGPSPELQIADLQRRARIVFNRPDAKEVTLVLAGKYLLPEQTRKAALDLPRPVGVLDRGGGKITVLADEHLELLLGESASEETTRGMHQHTFHSDVFPPQVVFGWRPYRPDFPVIAVTDITVQGRNAHVHHELRCPFPSREAQGPAKPGAHQVLLRVPPAAKAVRTTPEGRFDSQRGLAWVSVSADRQEAKPIVIEYDFTVPPMQSDGPAQGEHVAGLFIVPLIWPEQATRIDAKVRVWCDPGVVPLPDDVPDPIWRDRGTEQTDNKDSLPGLVLRASGVDLPLRLRLVAARSSLPPAVFDKGLVQVEASKDGTQNYRVRFLVRKLNTDHLNVRFPAAVAGIIPTISLNGKRIDDWLPSDSDNQMVRVPVRPSLYDQAVVLELKYQLPSSLTEEDRIGQTLLNPPQVPGAVFLGRVRWQLVSSPGAVVLPAGLHVEPEYHWQFRNWLLTPEAGTEDLERWLAGESAGPPQTASAVFWCAQLEPLRIWHFPRLVWFSLCSAVVLALGLGLSFASLSRLSFWFLIGVVACGGMALGLVWPAVLPAVVYGAQPGLAVLLLILAFQWMLQERYRRQVVFMPGFTRLKANSSLIVNVPSRPREASTVDAPATGGSGASEKK